MAEVHTLLDSTIKDSLTNSDQFVQEKNISAHNILSHENEKSRHQFQDKNCEDLKYCLPYLTGCLYATVLEDTLMQLRILMQCTNEIRASKALADILELRRKKYNVEPSKIIQEMDGIDPHNLHCMEYKLNKLESDKNLVYDFITSFYVNLALQCTYNPLVSCVKKLSDEKSYRIILQESIFSNKIIRRDLQKQLRLQRNHNKSALYDINAVIESLKNKVQDGELVSNIAARYSVNWQWARTEQHLEDIKYMETVPIETIEVYKQKYEHEQRVHTEVELITNILINETLEKINNWMVKFDKDMEALDLKIQKVKLEYNKTLEVRQGLQKKYDDHDTLIKNWTHFKDEREKARQYWDKMTNGAIVIQAWWRGLLVRLQMGPYKVVKKGKGPADKKNKNK